MTQQDARRIKQQLDAYTSTKPNNEPLATEFLVSLLGFIDGYVSAVISEDKQP